MRRSPSDNTCGHTNIEHAGKGLCKKCYRRALTLQRNPIAKIDPPHNKRQKMASCHPDRRTIHSDGLCSPCYQARYYYGINKLKMYKNQLGCCRLCSLSFPEDSLVVDHNHQTGKVRGLVCYGCNVAISGAENPLLNEALSYLKNYL